MFLLTFCTFMCLHVCVTVHPHTWPWVSFPDLSLPHTLRQVSHLNLIFTSGALTLRAGHHAGPFYVSAGIWIQSSYLDGKLFTFKPSPQLPQMISNRLPKEYFQLSLVRKIQLPKVSQINTRKMPGGTHTHSNVYTNILLFVLLGQINHLTYISKTDCCKWWIKLNPEQG